MVAITGEAAGRKLADTGAMIAEFGSAFHGEFVGGTGAAFWFAASPERLGSLRAGIGALWKAEPVTLSWLEVAPS
jgi:hypothetical protein